MLGGAAVALAPAAAFATTGPDVGKPAPQFTAVDSNGKTWSLADLKGKVVVLETTNHDCPYVRKHYSSKNMQDQQREAAAKGVVWLTVGIVRRRRAGRRDGRAGQRAHQEPRCRAGRRAARPAKQDRARLRRHRDAAHVHHRCQRARWSTRAASTRSRRRAPATSPRPSSMSASPSTKCWPASRSPTPRPAPTAAR